MLKQMLLVAFAFVLLSAMPAGSQTPAKSPDDRSVAASRPVTIFSSDGMEVGRMVDEVVLDNGDRLVIAEIEQRLGFGPTTIIVSSDMLRITPDRITLTVPADEVDNLIRGPEDEVNDAIRGPEDK